MAAPGVIDVDELVAAGLEAGLDAVGVAPAEPFTTTRTILEDRKAAGLHGGMQFTYRNPARSTDPSAALPGAASLVVGARTYRRAPAERPSVTGGRVARYSWDDRYEPLRRALAVVAGRLEEAGWRARVLADDNALVDREAARRAGLGWYGKNTLLLLPGRGSWFVLGSVITDAPLPPSSGPVPDGCGPCTRCITACPTGALVAPGVLDARRCLAWLLEAPGTFPIELRSAVGDRIYGCDDCQEACPVNVRADRRSPAGPAGEGEEPWIDLVELYDMDDGSLMERIGRWYVPRRQPRYVRRNILVALGNSGAGDEPGVASVLARGLADPDPLLRSHAVWAAASLGRGDLLDALAGEDDPEVTA
ncbi:MAG TPA: tRNA epoxyqueuosine(34) reductase QueG, partial [Acidimicrobiales bacterium]|nr:tRNA epoxyqueuosine(34) reductase QueG [Acidimicrobiales bacterium]